MKRILSILIAMTLVFSSLIAFADDNATSGSGGTSGALKDKGYYSGSEWAYKVSVFIGLTDQADKNKRLVGDFKNLGSVIVEPSNLKSPDTTIFGSTQKVAYLRGSKLNFVGAKKLPVFVDSKVPKIPITHKGNIGAVKSYFGDTTTLNVFIKKIAKQKYGKTPEELVSNLTFRINGQNKKLPPEEVLPIKNGGEYKNKVPWVIVYEPICLAHLKDNKTVLAFTATEYAIAQRKGLFNFYSKGDGEYIDSMTFSDLPNSVVLEESWFGYELIKALPDNVKWDMDRIVRGGGWGMRFLKANAKEEIEEPDPITADLEYRTNTDVITSVRVYASDDVTPDDRHINPYNPKKNTAEIVMTANGYKKTTTVVIPKDENELVWLKWHTPEEPSQVDVSVEIKGNRAVTMDGGARSATLKANVVELVEKTPPPIRINGEDGKPLRKPDFWVKPSPKPIRKEMKKWHEYDCDWHANWVDVPYDVWVDDDDDPNGGYYETEYRKEDHGWWTFERNDYYARIFVEFNIKPNRRAAKTKKTIDDWYMWSGNGVEAELTTRLSTNASKSRDVTKIQNAITRFPEFHYEKYNRVLEETEEDVFEFKENRYSTYKLRSHYIPFWYHDNDDFEIYAHGFDAWTPAGMLEASATDKVIIRGNVYNDGWHIAPLPVD
jgi:hypothetical protein